MDDFSTKEFLGKPLEEHIRKHFKAGLIKIIRNRAREGLIRTRMAGADIAKGEVIIFFDSHIECNVNWLPPLIEPIAEDKRISVCPFIDVIMEDTFEYRAQDEGARGAFDWELYYKRLPLLKGTDKNPTEPFEYVVISRCELSKLISDTFFILYFKESCDGGWFVCYQSRVVLSLRRI